MIGGRMRIIVWTATATVVWGSFVRHLFTVVWGS